MLTCLIISQIMAVVVNDNTKCQIYCTNKSPPTSVSSPPPLDLGMEVQKVEPVEIEVREVEGRPFQSSTSRGKCCAARTAAEAIMTSSMSAMGMPARFTFFGHPPA